MSKVSDTDHLIQLLLVAGTRGLHTSEIRAQGISGNPSQRMAEIEGRGYTTRREWEPYPSGPRRRGRRYWITARPSSSQLVSAPQDAVSSPTRVPAPVSAPLSLGQAQSSTRRPQCALDDDWDWTEAA